MSHSNFQNTELTLYYTIPNFNNPLELEPFESIMWEMEKMLVTSIFFISHKVFYPITERNQHFSNIQCCLHMVSVWLGPTISRMVKGELIWTFLIKEKENQPQIIIQISRLFSLEYAT